MQDLERMRAVTENYCLWQGLRLIPFGLMGLAFAVHLAEPAWWPLSGVAETVFSIAVMVACLSLFSWLNGYYRRNFGEVRGIPGRHSRRDALKWFVAYPLMGLSLVVDGLWKPPVFVTGLAWGVAIVAYWTSTGRGRNHYLGIAAVFAALTFLPALGVVAAGKPMLNLFTTVLGAAYIVAGILDHLELVRIMRPAREEG